MQSVIIHTSPAACCRRRDCLWLWLCACLFCCCCHSLWLPLALKLRTFAKLNGSSVPTGEHCMRAGRVEPSDEHQPRRCRLLSVSLRANSADSARHLIVGIIVRTNQINSSDFLTFVYPYLLCVYVGQVAGHGVCVCGLLSALWFQQVFAKIIQACNINKSVYI